MYRLYNDKNELAYSKRYLLSQWMNGYQTGHKNPIIHLEAEI